MNKIGLIIQGPLLSIGRSGLQLHERADALRTDVLTQFDCRENIRRIIRDFGSLFDAVVVSVRDDHREPGDGWPGAILVSSPDPGADKMGRSYKDKNLLRHFVSIYWGAVELQKLGIEYAIKIRTDQYLDLRKLRDSFLTDIKKYDASEAIFVPVIHRPTYFIHDLYFAARTKTLLEFCESIISFKELECTSSVHRDIVLKYAHAKYRDAIGVPERAYFPVWPPCGVSSDTRKIFEDMFSNVFYALNPEVLRSTEWRGAKYEKDYVDRLLDQGTGPRGYNIPALISTNWERYFNFRLVTYGKSVSVRDGIIVWIGAWGWKCWDFIRHWTGKIVGSFSRLRMHEST
jgi:hypothetical protein